MARVEWRSESGVACAGEGSIRAVSGRGPRRGRILVMDDDGLVREMLRRQLAVFGFEVETFAEGREAVAAYLRARDGGAPFGALVLDLQVPGGWGGERTLAELRAVEPDVKAMVCSGSVEGSPERYLRQGFKAVLCKPYSLADLRHTLDELLA